MDNVIKKMVSLLFEGLATFGGGGGSLLSELYRSNCKELYIACIHFYLFPHTCSLPSRKLAHYPMVLKVRE